MKKILIAIIAVLLGVVSAFAFLHFLPQLPLHPSHPVFTTFGVRKPRIIGFQPYWTVGKGEDNYAPYLTDVSYFGLVVDVDGKIVHKVNSAEEEPGWTKLQSDQLQTVLGSLKKNRVQTSLLIHGGNEASISALMADPEQHAIQLLDDVEPLMKQHGFSDLNLDIESFVEASPAAQQRFTTFAQTIKSGLIKRQLGTLSIDISPSTLTRPLLIDPTQIHTYADQVILMGYDFHYRGSYVSGPVAPVGGGGENREFDIKQSIQSLATMIEPEKIILGMPLYGYEWDTSSEGPNAPVVPGTGKTMTTAQVASLLQKCASCSAVLDPVAAESSITIREQGGEYFQQIYTPTTESVNAKTSLVQKYNLGGVALWALGQEDHSLLEPLAAYKKTFTRR